MKKGKRKKHLSEKENIENLEDLRAAYHEAGHAVVSIVLDLPFDYILIETALSESVQLPKEAKGAVFLPIKYQKRISRNTSAGLLNIRDAVVSAAGRMSEYILMGDKSDEYMVAGAEADRGRILLFCQRALGSDEQTKTAHHINLAAENQAEEILRENWQCVVTVANNLLRSGNLKYSEIAEMVNVKKRVIAPPERRKAKQTQMPNRQQKNARIDERLDQPQAITLKQMLSQLALSVLAFAYRFSAIRI